MHRVNKAIILAAGIGKRLQPITLHTPKPLIKVNGTRMIDTIIQGLHANGIYEIYIVVGHLKEQFEELKKEYQNIQLIENPYYNQYNNISSLYVARNHLENSIILDGDQIIYNYDILTPSFKYSGYNAIWNENYTNEWLMTVENDVVIQCKRNGGKQGWQLFSISRWNSEDGKRLKYHLEIEFEKHKNTQIYWDDVVMFCYPSDYTLGIQKMKKGDIVEIDNPVELTSLDKNYLQYIENENEC